MDLYLSINIRCNPDKTLKVTNIFALLHLPYTETILSEYGTFTQYNLSVKTIILLRNSNNKRQAIEQLTLLSTFNFQPVYIYKRTFAYKLNLSSLAGGLQCNY